MIRTISGDWYGDTGFEERPWQYGDNISVFSGGADDTTIVQTEPERPVTPASNEQIAV